MHSLLRLALAMVGVATLVGYPLVSALSSFLGIENRSLAIAFRGGILGVVLVYVVFVGQTFLDAPKNKQNTFFWTAWWGFWIAYLICMVSDESLPLLTGSGGFREKILFAVGVTMTPSIALVMLHWKSNDRLILNGIIFIGTIALLSNLYFIIFHGGFRSAANYRASTDSLNPISFGHLAVTVLLTSIWIVADWKSNVNKAVVIIPISTAVVALALSSSRGPVLSLAGSLIILAVARPKLIKSISFLMLSFSGAYVVYSLAKRGSEFYIVDRFNSGIFRDEARSRLLSESFAKIYDSPIVGVGFDPQGIYPHNLLVESYLLFGLATGIPFTILFVITILRSIKIAKAQEASFWRCLLFFQYAIGGMFSGSLADSAGFFSMMVLTIAVPAVRQSNAAHGLSAVSNPKLRGTQTFPQLHGVPALRQERQQHITGG